MPSKIFSKAQMKRDEQARNYVLNMDPEVRVGIIANREEYFAENNLSDIRKRLDNFEGFNAERVLYNGKLIGCEIEFKYVTYELVWHSKRQQVRVTKKPSRGLYEVGYASKEQVKESNLTYLEIKEAWEGQTQA